MDSHTQTDRQTDRQTHIHTHTHTHTHEMKKARERFVWRTGKGS